MLSIFEGNDPLAAEAIAKVSKRHVAYALRVKGVVATLQFRFKRLLSSSYSLSFIAASIEALDRRFFVDKTDFYYSVSVEGETIPMNVLNTDRDEVKIARRLPQGEANPAA